MKLESGFLKSRVARRIFLLFFASALVPVLAFGAYSFVRVRTQLQEQSRERVEETSKQVGMSLVEKLQFLSVEMDIVAQQFAANPTMSPSNLRFSRDRFVAFCREQAGSMECFHGERPPIPVLDEDQLKHLDSGEPLLVAQAHSGTDPGHLILGLRIPESPSGAVLWAESDLSYLLNIDDGGRFSTSLELFVLNAEGGLLYTSMPLSADNIELIRRQFAVSELKLATWQTENDSYTSAIRYLPLGLQFSTPALTVVVSQSTDQIVQPVRQFQRVFPFFILGSLLLVAFLSTNQIRRSLDPLEKLTEGTQRIASADFETRVEVDSKDEFQDLAESFNRMALQLGNQFDTLEAVAEIDRAILSAFHTREIVRTALNRIPALLGSSQICIVIADFEEPSRVSIFAQNGREKTEIPTIERQIPEDSWNRLVAQRDGVLLSPNDPLAPSQLADPSFDSCEALALPIVVKERPVGALILGFGDPHNITAETRRRASQFSNQLAVALSNAHLLEELDELNLSTLTALARTVDAKSPWTAGHSERVTRVGVLLAQQLGLSEAEIERINRGGLLHDIGKIGIPAEILDKPGRLTPDEFETMKQHAVIGAKILEPVKAFADVIPLVRSHHERFDGRGYPDGLAGEDIRFDVRILAVSDVFDALYSDRPYRAKKDFDDVVGMIREGAGTHFDPVVVTAFLELTREQRHVLVSSFATERDRQYNIFVS